MVPGHDARCELVSHERQVGHCVQFKRAKAADEGVKAERLLRLRTVVNKIDRAPHGIAPIQASLRPSQHLNPLQVNRRPEVHNRAAVVIAIAKDAKTRLHGAAGVRVGDTADHDVLVGADTSRVGQGRIGHERDK